MLRCWQGIARRWDNSWRHSCSRDGAEVDIVLERGAHELAGIEVKATATVTAADFRGLRKLKDAAGKRFVAGGGGGAPAQHPAAGAVCLQAGAEPVGLVAVQCQAL